MGEQHRDKIRKSNILNRLVKHAEGLEDMKPTEVQAAMGLLNFALPKLQPIDPNTGDATVKTRMVVTIGGD